MKPTYPRISRRQFFRLTGGAALYSLLPTSFSGVAAETEIKFIAEASCDKTPCDIKALTRKLFESVGGMSRFISNGDIVVIKPNLSWARAPELGATTHPDVLETVIILCQEAGAKKVRIADNTIHEARNCFDWFIGRNDLNISIIDHKTGGCYDGLTADGVNQNQGAESTVCSLISILRMHSLAYAI